MAENTDQRGSHILTDHDRIETLAETHNAGPRVVDRDDDVEMEIDVAPDVGDGDRTTWEEFFEWFDTETHVLRYQPPPEDGQGVPEFEIVGRQGGSDQTDAEDTTRASDDVETEKIATSDTGDVEPVAVDPKESTPDDSAETHETSKVGTADAERASSRAGEDLVLDEIHYEHVGPGSDLDDEYLRFQNEGDDPIDLSGWTVENEEGQSYEFPEETVLGPDESITLHSGQGADSGDDRYWNADESVWDSRHGTIHVSDATGEEVLQMPYKG